MLGCGEQEYYYTLFSFIKVDFLILPWWFNTFLVCFHITFCCIWLFPVSVIFFVSIRLQLQIMRPIFIMLVFKIMQMPWKILVLYVFVLSICFLCSIDIKYMSGTAHVYMYILHQNEFWSRNTLFLLSGPYELHNTDSPSRRLISFCYSTFPAL